MTYATDEQLVDNRPSTFNELYERYQEPMKKYMSGYAGRPADDMSQELWMQIHETGPQQIENVRCWLWDLSSRIALAQLRARKRHERRLITLRRVARSMFSP